jgi:hypothetical protein
MESAGGAIQHDVIEILKDGVSSLAHGRSTDSLEQTLSEEVKTGIARKSELYRRNAQLTGLCELPERDDVVAECQTQATREQSFIESSKAASLATLGAGAFTTTGHSAGEGQLPAVENAAALGEKSATAKQEGNKPRPGKERKGDASLLAGKRAVNFRTAEQYLGLTERQRQNLVRDQILVVEGKGQNKKITTDSLRAYLPPENPN